MLQVYASQALKDNSVVGDPVLVACSNSCVCTSLCSSSQLKKPFHRLQLVLLAEDLVIFSTREVGVTGLIPRRTNCKMTRNGLGMSNFELS